MPIRRILFYTLAKRDSNLDFKIQIANLINNIINPSLNDYINYLEKEYLPLARDTIGISALPAGKKAYSAKIKQETTLSILPEAIHELGLKSIQKLSAEISAIGLKKYGVSEIAAIFQLAKNDSLSYFKYEKDILDYNFSALEKAKSKLDDWFDIMPRTESTIQPYPVHRSQTGAAGEYHPPSEDGLPGIFYINTYEPKHSNRLDQEATLFHELIPGHHFQIALTYENNELPSINKYLWNAGHGEGWALYAERLADEMGLYRDELSRLGMLSNEIFRAARLVIDTGIHYFDWNREQAINYLSLYTALSKSTTEAEIDRYMMTPGQATTYFLGKCEIESLRDLAKKQLGSHFDIREFHNQVLNNGSISLPILRKHITQWLKINCIIE